MPSIDTLELTSVIDAQSGFPIGVRSHERPPRFLGSPFVLAQSHVPVPLTGSTADTPLASVTLPGGVMGAGGSVVIEAVWSATANANSKSTFVKFGSVAYGTATLFSGSAATARQSQWVGNRGALNSQISHHPIIPISQQGAAPALSLSSVNTAADIQIVLSAQLAVAGDTITLESYRITVYPSE